MWEKEEVEGRGRDSRAVWKESSSVNIGKLSLLGLSLPISLCTPGDDENSGIGKGDESFGEAIGLDNKSTISLFSFGSTTDGEPIMDVGLEIDFLNPFCFR